MFDAQQLSLKTSRGLIAAAAACPLEWKQSQTTLIIIAKILRFSQCADNVCKFVVCLWMHAPIAKNCETWLVNALGGACP